MAAKRTEAMVDILYDDLDPFFPVAPERDSDKEESPEPDGTDEEHVRSSKH